MSDKIVLAYSGGLVTYTMEKGKVFSELSLQVERALAVAKKMIGDYKSGKQF